MTKLQRLYAEQGQSPWLDNLTRPYLRDGTLARLVEAGVRGVTANPTIFARAIEGSDAYDEQFRSLVASGRDTTDAYWELVIDDIRGALDVLGPVFQASCAEVAAAGSTDGPPPVAVDGFVSLEVAPELAADTEATIAAARNLHERIDRPNLFVKIPATPAGIPAIRQMTAEGRNINITLIFSLSRYREVIDAYESGLEAFAASGGDLSKVHSVASFFVSRVDTEVDKRLEAIGTARAHYLRGRAAVAQAKLAYQIYRESLASSRWRELAAAGANPQRTLWASTSTKNPAYPDTLYVDELIGPGTVNTLTEGTIAAFEDHGSLQRAVDAAAEDAEAHLAALASAGIDMDEVGRTLEDQGVASFHQSFAGLLEALESKGRQLVSG